MAVTNAFISENTLAPDAPEPTEVNTEIQHLRTPVLIQNFTGVPSVVDIRGESEDSIRDLALTLRIDTPVEEAYFVHGGIGSYVLHELIAN